MLCGLFAAWHLLLVFWLFVLAFLVALLFFASLPYLGVGFLFCSWVFGHSAVLLFLFLYFCVAFSLVALLVVYVFWFGLFGLSPSAPVFSFLPCFFFFVFGFVGILLFCLCVCLFSVIGFWVAGFSCFVGVSVGFFGFWCLFFCFVCAFFWVGFFVLFGL